jgi:hypothetical protein
MNGFYCLFLSPGFRPRTSDQKIEPFRYFFWHVHVSRFQSLLIREFVFFNFQHWKGVANSKRFVLFHSDVFSVRWCGNHIRKLCFWMAYYDETISIVVPQILTVPCCILVYCANVTFLFLFKPSLNPSRPFSVRIVSSSTLQGMR